VNRYEFKSEVDVLIIIFNWIFFFPEYFKLFLSSDLGILKHFKVQRISRERHYIVCLMR
jgi:hypothetical protein